jgi:poly-D-alanine transfer protein DltD
MKQRFPLSGYIIFGFIAIGVIVSFRQLLIPIIVLGLIFVLYKFPPSRWSQLFSNRKMGRTASKKAKFRVIQGNKGHDEEPPRYH